MTASATNFTTTIVSPDGALGPVAVRRFSVDEYHRLIQDGYFAADERFELLEGLITQKMARDPIHDSAFELALAELIRRVPAGWRVRPQCAITTGDSQPEPDLVIVRGTPRDNSSHHPAPADIALVVEVSNTSLAEDRTLKCRLYAQAGIQAYWIINVVDRQVEVYSEINNTAQSLAYAPAKIVGIDESVAVTVGGAPLDPIAVADLLP
jgi:Uma2 family endonuclease